MKKFNFILLVVIATVLLSGCTSKESLESAILFEGGVFTKFFVYPVALLLYSSTKLLGANYFLGILVTTLVVRTLGWPIYAKTNDMSLKMQAMQPEQAKIQAKYAGKTDNNSKANMQKETLELYKKYGLNPLGCLLPFLQMPIFIAVYQAISRLPNNIGTGFLDLEIINAQTTIFGLDLLDLTKNNISGNIFYSIVPILVGITMFLLTYLGQKRSSKAQANVPDYKKNPKADSMKKQMAIMMYAMVGMMVWFTYISASALGVYWIIANTYQILQTSLGYLKMDKKLESFKK